MRLLNIVRLVRVSHYVKNVFIFLPLFFALKILEIEILLDTFIAFIAFSLSASSIYILNDYLDLKYDLKHPVKRRRPLASGAISKRCAAFIATLFLLSGFSLMLYISLEATKILLLYIFLNILYSVYLKHQALTDITVVAIGFVLRLFIGSSVADVDLSMWIVIMTFLLALFLALAKRRDDVVLYEQTKEKVRKTIGGYNLQFLDMAMTSVASVIIVSYIMYTTSAEVIQRIGSEYLYLTVLFVILGIMRYLIITIVEDDSGSPTKIVLKDRFLQLMVLLWLASFSWLLY